MQDIVDKFDRAKELVALARNPSLTAQQEDAAAVELLDLGIDAIGELLANSRRIAVALETIAENTKPVEYTVEAVAAREPLDRNDVVRIVTDELRNVNSPLHSAMRRG